MKPLNRDSFLNAAVFEAIQDALIGYVEAMPETEAYCTKRDELMAQIKDKLPRPLYNEIFDLYTNMAVQWADEALMLGIALGHNPSAIINTPSIDHLRAQVQKPKSVILDTILSAVRDIADSGPEYEAWDAKFTEVEGKIGKRDHGLSQDMQDVVYQGMLLRGEAMFMLGWELRGNPSAIFDLPDDGEGAPI